MRRLIPDTIVARTLLVLIVGLTVSHVLSVAMYFTDRASATLFSEGERTGRHVAAIGHLVDDAAPADRPRIVQLADQPSLHVTWSPQAAVAEGADSGGRIDVLRDALAAHIDGRSWLTYRLRLSQAAPPEAWLRHLDRVHGGQRLGEAALVSLQLRDGSWLNFAAPIEEPEPFWSLRFALSMAVMLLAVGALSAVVVHHQTKPLITFARAAERLGTDVKAPAIPEYGPGEVRRAIRAFNEMQRRVRRFVEDRTQMLAAISHDLGTPITRLRLRAEFIEDDEQRRRMLADLDDMEHMVTSALAFARDEAASEPHILVDLKTLLQRVTDDMADAGHAVTLEIGDAALPYGCRPAALRRALTNLIDNAVKYGGEARLSVAVEPESIEIRIDDRGPGIPAPRQEDAFKPFHRLEASRSRETGGTGLGLTVARTILRALGGDVTLANRPEGGLRVVVRLPR